MNIHTKEFLMDILTLIANIFVVLLITYLVFNKGISGYWYLILLVWRPIFTPEEYKNKIE